MRFSSVRIVSLASVAAAAFSLNAAFAGDVLRLRTGDVRIENANAISFMSFFAGSANQAQRTFVIQFAERIAPEATAQLESLGLEVLRYIPDDAYLVRGTESAVNTARSVVPGVSATSPFRPEWKVSTELSESAFTASGIEAILVTAVDEMTAYRVAGVLKGIPGVRVRGVSGKDVVVDSTASRASDMAKVEGVEWIQKAPVFVTWDYQAVYDTPAPAEGPGTKDYVFTGFESGTKIMNFDAAWSRGFTGAGQIVGVADTGLDLGKDNDLHADFQGQFYKGFAIGLGSSSWGDPMGHGTHVAGSVLGNGAKSDGHLRGGAFGSKLIMLGMWSDILDNLAPGSDFNKIIGTAYDQGARIHSNSWGSPTSLGEYDSFASKVDDYMWAHPDMLVLFAAGNSGVDANADGHIDTGSVSSPSTAKNTLTVGASENELAVGGIQKPLGQLREGDKKWGVPPLKDDLLSNNANGIAAFSSRGPTKDGRIKPEIVAPGTNIISTRSRNPKASPLWGVFNDSYVYAGGTSMATPLTAGAAAVAREFLVKKRGIANPSAAVLKATLIHTAKDLFPGQYGTGAGQELPTPRPNVHEGYGRVDMDYVTSLGSETALVDDTAGLAKGEERTFPVTIRQGGSLRATLSYTDAPATPSADKTLVNDLDLKIVGPNGEVVTRNDHVNNTEMVELKNLPAGQYKVVVSGYNVPIGKNGKQPFGLVMSTDSARRFR